jgi:glycerophosphoryl diester phosphodiesterase
MVEGMVRVIAHRTCPKHEPENSLTGIRKAGELGADGVEIDVRLTRDGVPVLVHDHTLWRLLRWPVPARFVPFERLRARRRRDHPSLEGPIPTFAEALEALPKGVFMAIDTKDTHAAGAVVQEVRRQGAEGRVELWAQSMEAVRVYARELPEVPRALLRDTRAGAATRRFLDDAIEIEAHAISAHWDRITPPFVAMAHDMGLQVYAMAQDPGSQRAKIVAGLDAVVTDWPEEALAVVGG